MTLILLNNTKNVVVLFIVFHFSARIVSPAYCAVGRRAGGDAGGRRSLWAVSERGALGPRFKSSTSYVLVVVLVTLCHIVR